MTSCYIAANESSATYTSYVSMVESTGALTLSTN